MKTIDLRSYVLDKNKKAGYYHGKMITNCGLMGKPNAYWIELEDGTSLSNLSRIEPVVTYLIQPDGYIHQ